MRPIFMPERARARRADWAPGPGVFVPLPVQPKVSGMLLPRREGCRIKHTTSGTDLDVEGSDAELLAAGRDVLSSQHGSVGRRLVTVGLDLHTTGNTADGFAAAGIIQNVSPRTRNRKWQARGWGESRVAGLLPPQPQVRCVQSRTNLRSVTWTKVSFLTQLAFVLDQFVPWYAAYEAGEDAGNCE